MSDKPKSVSKKDALPWGDTEIVMHYRAARDPAEMIKILAELNDTTPSRIRRVLINRGETPPAPTPSRTGSVRNRVFTELVRGGERFSADEVARNIGRSRPYVMTRIKGVDHAVIDGVEYRVVRYSRRG